MHQLNSENVRLHDWTHAGPVEQAYEFCQAPVAMIVGPTGGGKSTGSARRCLRVARWQHPSPRDGVRKARILCVCPTYRRAWDTVMPSYFKVFPQSMGDFRGSKGDPADHKFDTVVAIDRQPARLHVEVLFRAVNDLDIEEFFRGFEFTAMWLPEADTNKDLGALLSLGSNRAGRYPEPEDRPDHAETDAYKGIWGDANAPLINSPFHTRFYLERAKHPMDRVFIQPGGFSANAENMQNLRKISRNYYGDMAAQLDAYDIGRMINNRPGYGRHGKPVHPNFDHDLHVAKVALIPQPDLPVYIGVDAGGGAMTPAATFKQRTYAGQWRTFAEIHLPKGQQLNTEEFGQSLRQVLNSRFGRMHRNVGALLCIDPAAGARTPGSQYNTAIELQHHSGIEAVLAPSNDPKVRRSAVDKKFKQMIAPGEPGMLIDPACTGLITGYAGGFHYPKRADTVSPIPAKNEYSHVCEADEYAVLTIEGLDATQSPFIRQDGAEPQTGPQVICEG